MVQPLRVETLKKGLLTTGAGGLLALFALSAWAPLSLEYQFGLSLVLLSTVIVATWFPRYPDGRFGRVLIMMICLFLSLRYWVFRTTVTLQYVGVMDAVFAALLYLAETYGILIYIFGMFVNAWPIARRSPALPHDPSAFPSVDIYIPTYSEPVDIVKLTAIAASQLDYPPELFTVYILDDGGTDQKLNDPDPIRAAAARDRAAALKRIAGDLNIQYATRERNVSAKAGNLNESLMACECTLDEEAFDRVSCIKHGIEQGCGHLILILDCDHVPARNFLRKTVGFFIEDPQLFLLQTPHFFINPDPVEKNLEIFRKGPSENEMFYGAVHLGLDFWNASFFCGSAAVLRRKFLMEVGGLSGSTITEDAETALELHAKGYNSAYLNTPLIIGLTPETFDDFILQRSRWAQGMIQIFILKNPFFQKGLSWYQKFCYFNSSFFWFFGVARVIFYLAPLVLLFFGLRIYNASLPQVLAYAVPHLAAAYILANYLFGRFRHPFISELYETIQSFYLLPAIVSAILKPRSPVFKVTPKAVSLNEDFLSHLALPFYLMLVISVMAYGMGFYTWHINPGLADAIVLCMAWNTFNITILLACLGVVWERRQVRGMHRYPTNETAELQTRPEGIRIPVKIVDLSISGSGLVVDRQWVYQLEGDNPILHTKDSYGNSYALPVRIINRRKRSKGGGMVLGCRFDVASDDLETLTRIVNFVYGDSSRWRLSGQSGHAGTISTVGGLLRILRLGIMGSVINAKGVWGIFSKGVGRWFHRTIRRRINTFSR